MDPEEVDMENKPEGDDIEPEKKSANEMSWKLLPKLYKNKIFKTDKRC